ncbi:hypothetical protein BDZ97DRAFT_1802896 [Flammula alnicola]|nr:hypothetical protein BDZ97DRAFT_1802896 [Flammula alnicola]
MAQMVQHATRFGIPNYSRPLRIFQHYTGATAGEPSGSGSCQPSLSMPSGTWKFNMEELLEPLSRVYIDALCGVCGDRIEGSEAFSIPNCGHVFCKDCLRSYILVKLGERQYPIACPVCLADRTPDNHVEDEIIQNLDIPAKETDILIELQLALYSTTLACPKCKQSMNVDRQDFLSLENNVVTCPLTRCRHRWCTECDKEVPFTETKHHCKNKKLDRLMRRKGWKYCPGCRTPIQKESGCNHMTCEAAGCRV